jgi:hypothetical protein
LGIEEEAVLRIEDEVVLRIEVATSSEGENAASEEEATLEKDKRRLVVGRRVPLPPLLVPDDSVLEISAVFAKTEAREVPAGEELEVTLGSGVKDTVEL